MTGGEVVGFLAALLTFTTFYMKTMVPLRVVGISSNIAFLSYAMIEHLVPIFLLHGALLPLNLLRLYEILKLVREIREARTGDLALDPLLPFVTRRLFKEEELRYIAARLTLERAVAERKQTLARQGNIAQTEADDALAAALELERMRAELERTIAHTEERRQAAERGVFLADDGRNPEWAFQSEDRVLLEVAQATRAIANAEGVLAEARTSAAVARAALELISASPIVAPPGSLVWSVLARVGTAVDVGTPIAEWIDCDAILVDVPVSDVEVGLLRKGMPADVILEGETQMRNGSLLLTRAAASILGSEDLAAIAKGHGAGLGQVIVRL